MKKIFIAILLIALFIPASANAEDSDRWIWIASSDKIGWFFDGRAIAADNYSKNIITVWVKVQYTLEYAQELVDELNYDKKIYKDFSYNIVKYKFDIKARKNAIMTVISYTTDGQVIEKNDFPIEWADIVPGTAGEYEFETVKDYYLENY